MNMIPILWSMSASAVLTLALIHLIVWLNDRRAYANLAFVGLALSVSGLALCELLMFSADTAEQFGSRLRWTHLPVSAAVASIVAFVHLYFGTGRRWLGSAVLLLQF